MSAYLTSGDAINALATYWDLACKMPGRYSTPAGQLEHAYRCHQRAINGTSAEPDQTAWQLLQDATATGSSWQPWQSVQQILILENQRSLEARYPGDDPDALDYRSAEGAEYQPRRSAEVRRWHMQRQTGRLVGILNGYEYQSCEHDGWEQSVAYYLCRQIRSNLLSDFESSCCKDDSERGWASWQEPERDPSVPETVCLSDLLRR